MRRGAALALGRPVKICLNREEVFYMHRGRHPVLMRMRNWPAVELTQDGTRYFDLHHTANDVLTEVHRDSLDHAMRALLAVAYAASLDVE